MKISRQTLATLSVDELRQVQEMADDLIRDYNDRRRKELWGNVVAAIEKYEQEIEPIEILLPDDGEPITIRDMKVPGEIATQFD